jgi:pimeloyl-ACP methyl ester carboxylesterase
MSDHVTAQQWFSSGTRIPYDPARRRILRSGDRTDPADAIKVFERVALGNGGLGRSVWTTFLPGFPDGSFGWARVDHHLGVDNVTPRIYVEFIGQGDSDKPPKYSYGTMERADLVEAQWESKGIRSTFIVSFDYSSLVTLELLSRQHEQMKSASDSRPIIEGVLLINGGYFADAHSHPLMTTPALRSPLGGLVTWVGQRSRLVARQLLRSMFSKEYVLSSMEFNEIYEAIRRRNGFPFVSQAAGFVAEHRSRYEERWDLRRLYLALQDSVSFHIVGSEGDIFEPNQVVKARERLGDQGLDIRMVSGGHMTTSEQPEQLARIIEEVGPGNRGTSPAG